MLHRRYLTILVLALHTGPVLGQAAPDVAAAPDVFTAEARRRFQEGMAASNAGDYERARAAYLQTYALNQSPEVLRNLGVAEVRSGHLVSGARRLSAYLRGAPAKNEQPDQREFARELLAQAEARVGRLKVDVDPAGAEVLLDGEVIGKAPLTEHIYVEPGSHEVTARKDGFVSSSSMVNAAVGQLVPIAMTLAASSASGHTSSPAPYTATLPTTNPVRPRSSNARSIVLIAGAGATALSAGLGTYFAIRAAGADDDAEGYSRTITTDFGPTGCSSAAGAASSACKDLHSALDTRDDSNSVASVAFITAGVLGAATVATYFLWRPRRAAVSWSIGPTFGQGPGLSARGEF